MQIRGTRTMQRIQPHKTITLIRAIRTTVLIAQAAAETANKMAAAAAIMLTKNIL